MNENLSSELLCFSALALLAIAIFGTAGNLLVACALGSGTTNKSVTTILLINLAICVLPVCLLCLPYSVVQCFIIAYSKDKSINGVWMKVMFIIASICNQVEIHTIAALAVNRFCAIMYPAFFKRHLTQRKTVICTITFIWIYSILLWLPVFFGLWGHLNVDQKLYFVEVASERRYKTIILVFFCFIVPFMTTLLCHIIMIVKFRKTQNTEYEGQVETPWKKQVNRTMTVIFIVFIVCSLPHVTIHVLKRFDDWPRSWVLLHVLFFSRYCLNPAVYIYTSRRYKKDCVRFLRQLRGGELPVHSKNRPRIPYNHSSKEDTVDNL